MLISEYMLMNIMRKYTAYVDIFISYSIFLLNACNQVVLIHLFLYHCESRSLVSHFIYSQAYFKVRLFKSPVSMERFFVCECMKIHKELHKSYYKMCLLICKSINLCFFMKTMKMISTYYQQKFYSLSFITQSLKNNNKFRTFL